MRDKREEADPTLATWCIMPERNGRPLLDDGATRPLQSVAVYEREHSVRVSVGTDRLVPVYAKREDGPGRYRTGREQNVYKNAGWIYSYRSGELRVYTSHASGGHRYIHQVTNNETPVQHGLNANREIQRALMDLWARAVNRGLDVPIPFGGSVSELVHTGAYRMLHLQTWQMSDSLGLGPFLRSRTVQEFTSKAFGRRRYRKDLVKAVAGCTISWQIAVARELVKVVPIDWVISFLKTEHATLDAYEIGQLLRQPGKLGGAYDIAQTMHHLTPESRRRLLLEDHWDYTRVRDTLRMIRRQTVPTNAFPPDDFPEPGELRKVRSWGELHDILTREMNARREIEWAERDRRQAERRARQPRQIAVHGLNDPFGEIVDRPAGAPLYSTKADVSGKIKPTEVAAALHKLTVPWLETEHAVMDEHSLLSMGEFPSIPIRFREHAYVIRRAKQTDELEGWGSKLRNCIASYAANAIRGTTNLFGVYDTADDKLVANMEISNEGVIRQLFGNMNQRLASRPDMAIRHAVRTKLEEVGIKLTDFRNEFRGVFDELGVPVYEGEPWHANMREGYRDLEDQQRQHDRFAAANVVIQDNPARIGIDYAFQVVQ